MSFSRRTTAVRAVIAMMVIGCVGLCGAARGDDAVASKVLPREEAAQGWIKLFDNETLFGWDAIGEADWKVEGGNLVCERGSGGWLSTTSQFADFELRGRIRLAPETFMGVLLRASRDGHWSENGSTIAHGQEPEGGAGPWRNLQVRASGNTITVTVDGERVDTTVGARSVGHIGLVYFGRGKIEIESLKLRPINTTPLFNGADLTGWNIIPGHPAVVSVVDGAINVRDGRGQVETEGVFRDFILQLDIISHGEHLNSGVFYRGPVGEFWRGYESQVRNQWAGDDRSQPVDFGTGGIYGNQPARLVASSDHEWFTKTIVATGPHMAVWIDGYQVSDYLDVRPPVNNYDGKRGYIAEAGTIHLQGHDPGTNLSFKNFNIQEYPAE